MRFIGPTIPRFWRGIDVTNAKPDDFIKYFVNIPDVVHLGVGPLVNGKIIGFEYFCWMTGFFKIKVGIILILYRCKK